MGADAENQLSKYWLKKLNTCGEAKILKELKAKYIEIYGKYEGAWKTEKYRQYW